MESIVNFFSIISFPVWSTYLGLSVGTIGTVATIYAFFKSKKLKEPFCVVSNRNIISPIMNDVPKLNVQYEGKPIDRLSLTTIYFWNAGSETINGEDTPKNSPFQIMPKNDSVIYNIESKFTTREANGFKFLLNNPKNVVDLEFDFFDKNDGFVIEILHSGKSADDIELHALFKGAKPLIKRATFSHQHLPKPIQELLAGDFRLPLSFFLFLTPLLVSLDAFFNITGINHEYKFQTDIFAALLLTASGWFFSFKLFKTRVPKGFSLLDD